VYELAKDKLAAHSSFRFAFNEDDEGNLKPFESRLRLPFVHVLKVAECFPLLFFVAALGGKSCGWEHHL